MNRPKFSQDARPRLAAAPSAPVDRASPPKRGRGAEGAALSFSGPLLALARAIAAHDGIAPLDEAALFGRARELRLTRLLRAVQGHPDFQSQQEN